ncbi:hypothetical protein BGZ63DRAFT_455942 [Mariannaea sp. PMI_226]|nr:hypothetical protein BGZ63DRAFT_455942 [Mariannaea sp. PMI_226]
MADIIAQLQVLSRDNGCLLDISALLDLSICPNVNIQTKRPHKIAQSPDYVTVTPTNYKKGKQSYSKASYRRGASLYEVPNQVCQKNTVTHDLGLLVPAGLLTKEQLEEYLRKTGALPPKHHLPHNQEVNVDPLLGLQVGKDGSLLDVDVGGKKGGVTAKVGKNGDKSLLELGLLNKDGLLTLNLDGHNVLHLRSEDKPLAFVQAGGKKINTGAPVALSALTGEGKPLAIVQAGGKKVKQNAPVSLTIGTHSRRAEEDDPLAHVQVGGKKTKQNSAIDLTALTDALNSILDVQVGGKTNKDKNPLINLDLLTHDDEKKPNNGGNNGGNNGNNGGNNGNNGGNNGNNGGNNGNNGGNNGNNGNNGGNNGNNGGNNGGNNSNNGNNGGNNGNNGSNGGNNGNNGNNGGNHGNNGGNNGNNGGNGSNNGNNGGNHGNNGGNNGSNNGGNHGNNGGNSGSNNGSNNGGNHGNNGANNGHYTGQNGNGHSSTGNGYNAYNVRGDYTVSGSNGNNGYESSSKQHYNTHYQPLCNMGLKKEYLKDCEKEHAHDVNHCLAICQARGALLTLDANVKVSDIAHIHVCLAVEFDEKAQDGNCRYLVGPETKPCEHSHLEHKDDCYAFIRN